MNIKMKQSILGVMNTLLVCSIATAAAPNMMNGALLDKDGVNNSKSHLEVTFGALILQPTGTNLDYAVLGFPFPVVSPHWDVATINPSYSAGFDLGGRYIFQNNVNDVQLNWDHLNTNNSNSTYAGSGQFATPLFQSGPSIGQNSNPATQQAHAIAKFNYDVVNIDVGHVVDYSAQTQVRYFAGLSGAQLKEWFSVSFQDNAQTFDINSINKSRFIGIGPLFGVDGLYKLPHNIGVTGSLAASALMGSMQPRTDYISTSPEITGQNYQSITPRNTTQVVPGIEGKLGLNYVYSFDNGALAKVAVGYEYANYFNAIVAYNPATVFGEINTGTIALESLGKSVSNFAVNGPYVNLSIQFS